MNLMIASSFPPWLSKALVFSILAAIGGIIVLWGLLLEWKADKEWYFNEQYSNLEDLRKCKFKAKCGAKLVMAGICVEIIIAIIFAILDVSEKWKSDPRNKPISEVDALVYFVASGTNDAGTIESINWPDIRGTVAVLMAYKTGEDKHRSDLTFLDTSPI
jgi:hypothetical protein